MTKICGYARTSTVTQKAGLEAQIRDLKAAGCDDIFSEQTTAKGNAKRPELELMLRVVREGDTVVVTKPCRLARSTADLLAIAKTLRDKGVTLKILSMNVDTSNEYGKLMLTILGGIAEFERDLMLERQKEGIALAKAQNKYKGRVASAQNQAAKIVELRDAGKSVAQIMAETKVKRSSVFRILKDEGRTGRE